MKCTATSKQTGRQCGQSAVKGASVCRFHGGASPGVRAAAAERVAEQDARQALATLDALLGPAEAVENPLERLQQLAGEADRWQGLMAQRVARLTAVGYESVAGFEQVKAEVQLYTGAMDRLATILATIARLNIDARLAAIAGQQADTVIAAIDTALEWAGVPREYLGEAKRVAAGRLRGGREPAATAGELHLGRRLAEFERENARLRDQLAMAKAQQAPRLALEARPVPLVVDAPGAPVHIPAAQSFAPPPPPQPQQRGPWPQVPGSQPIVSPDQPRHGREFWAER